MEDHMLTATATNFFIARIKKLEKKEKNGFTGWDYASGPYFSSEIRKRASMKLTQKNLVNIANYCNFYWQRLEDEKEEKK